MEDEGSKFLGWELSGEGEKGGMYRFEVEGDPGFIVAARGRQGRAGSASSSRPRRQGRPDLDLTSSFASNFRRRVLDLFVRRAYSPQRIFNLRKGARW